MNPEEKRMLEESLELAQNNNKMLKHIRNAQRWASLTKLIYWGIIIAVAVGSYYYIQPYVDQVQKVMKESGAALDKIKGALPQ